MIKVIVKKDVLPNDYPTTFVDPLIHKMSRTKLNLSTMCRRGHNLFIRFILNVGNFILVKWVCQ